MPSTGALATVLKASTDDDLARGFARRGIAPAGIRDFFDAAEALLAPELLQTCLIRLDQTSLRSLVLLSARPRTEGELRETTELGGAALDDLRALFLVHDTQGGLAAWPEVGAALAAWPEAGLGDPSGTIPEPLGATLAADERARADRAAADHAVTAINAISELLFLVTYEPVPLLANGTIGRPGTRHLALHLHVDDASVSTLVDAAWNARLIARAGSQLVASGEHEDWLALPLARRWVVIAEAWTQRHVPGIRMRLGEQFDTVHGATLIAWLEWAFPGGRDWLADEVAARLHETELLGITAQHTIGTPAALVLRGDPDAAAEALAHALPAAVDKVYLQDDLTAVAPGPLETKIDSRLRLMADADGHSIASRFRFNRASITRALSGTETAESILDFLNSVTLSGLPQPLRYLVNETASRHGLLRVGALAPADPRGASYVRSDDPVMLRTVLVDRNLASLALRRDQDRLASPRELDQLYTVLQEAKYPVAAEDSTGRIVDVKPAPARRGDSGQPRSGRSSPVTRNPHRTLVERLRMADADAPEDAGEAWFARQLEAAIRSKSTVTVSVRMPNGTVVDYRLEPASVAGGRLRARDPLSEIERTLPLSSIAAVTNA